MGLGQVKTITSLTNARVKAVRALDMRKTRRETGLFVAEGGALLMTARQAGYRPETLLFIAQEKMPPATEDYIDWAMAEGVECLSVNQAILAKLTGKDNPQSVVGVFAQDWAELPQADEVGSGDVWLALEEVRDPGNLGTIIRTSDAAGVKGIVLVGNCCDPYQRECVRATMGSIFSVPLVKTSVESFLHWRRDWRGDVAGLHLQGSEDFRKAKLARPAMIVMGSEGPGLSNEVDQACTKKLRIPMAGTLDSLNLAVATALVLYEVQRESLRV
ncbi:MAG: TrmH family RNA methyltransferase [Hyphomicrobiaceae bacterium]